MSEEYIKVVDKNDNTLECQTRKRCHDPSDPLFHRVVYLSVFNRAGEFLLQKRSQFKLGSPNKWTVSVSGHVDCAEDELLTAVREAKEEIGIDVDPNELKYLGKVLVNYGHDKEWSYIYSVVYNGNFEINEEEVSEIRFFNSKNISEIEDELSLYGRKILEFL